MESEIVITVQGHDAAGKLIERRWTARTDRPATADWVEQIAGGAAFDVEESCGMLPTATEPQRLRIAE